MEFKNELSLVSLIKLISFLFWSGLYLWWAIDSKHSPEWCSRVVTLLHGLVASCIGIAQCGVKTFSLCSLTTTDSIRKLSPWSKSARRTSSSLPSGSVVMMAVIWRLPVAVPGGGIGLLLYVVVGYGAGGALQKLVKISWSQYALMVWSWGYFSFDLLWCLLYWTKNYTMLCHHISALVAINMYINMGFTGCTFACTIALLEITNPLLQTRWFLRNGGYGNTFLYYVVEITYLIMFLLLRGPLGTYLIYSIMRSQLFGIYEKLISLALYLVSMIFIYEIVGYVLYKYRNKIEEFRGFGNELAFILEEQQ